MTIVEKTEDEIDRVLNTCAECLDGGESAYPGATYEEGVERAVNWLLHGGENPFNE